MPPSPIDHPFGLTMVQLPVGEFTMGRSVRESEDFRDAALRHKVSINSSIFMATHPLTESQYRLIMGIAPVNKKGPKVPVVGISWVEAQELIKIINGQLQNGGRYRLPSEAEWEYAARAGSGGRFCFGDSESLLDDYGWYAGNAKGRLRPVRQKKANRWGLYDMHGNVGEWCQDLWHDSYQGAPADGSAWDFTPNGESRRVRRGGSSLVMAAYCGSAARHRHEASDQLMDVGLRLVYERSTNGETQFVE